MQSMWVQLVCFKQQWIDGIFPVLPVCPYGHRLHICCVNEPVSFYPAQQGPEWPPSAAQTVCVQPFHTVYVILYRDFFLLHMKPTLAHSPRSFILEKMLIPVGSSWALRLVLPQTQTAALIRNFI